MRKAPNFRVIFRNILGALASRSGYRLRHRRGGYRKLDGRGIEIGALHSPAKLSKHCSTEYCDVLSASEAAQLFPELHRARFVDVKHIVDLDKNALSSFATNQFDFVIMNHVIEHIANPIRVIHDAFRILKVNGKFVISAPDKGFNYDCNRDITSFDHLWSEYLDEVTSVDDDHYLDFLRAVHPSTLVDPIGVNHHIQHARERREHAHVWDSTAFHSMMEEGIKRLNISAHCILKSDGESNHLEYFGVWEKVKDNAAPDQ